MSLKPYKISFLDGSGRSLTLSEFKRFSKRDDMELVGDSLRQIAPTPSFFGQKLLKALTGSTPARLKMSQAEVPGLRAVGVTSDLSLAREATHWAEAQ